MATDGIDFFLVSLFGLLKADMQVVDLGFIFGYWLTFKASINYWSQSVLFIYNNCSTDS